MLRNSAPIVDPKKDVPTNNESPKLETTPEPLIKQYKENGETYLRIKIPQDYLPQLDKTINRLQKKLGMPASYEKEFWSFLNEKIEMTENDKIAALHNGIIKYGLPNDYRARLAHMTAKIVASIEAYTKNYYIKNRTHLPQAQAILDEQNNSGDLASVLRVICVIYFELNAEINKSTELLTRLSEILKEVYESIVVFQPVRKKADVLHSSSETLENSKILTASASHTFLPPPSNKPGETKPIEGVKSLAMKK